MVIYTYFNSPSSNYNLSFFVTSELQYRENIDYVVVINGFSCPGITFPNLPNLTLLYRENIGFDFGGHAHALNHLDSQNKSYDYYFFMNSGVCGPILRPEFTDNHWSTCFIRKINDHVKLVGTTIVCLPAIDAGGLGPKVEGFFFMTDTVGLGLLRSKGSIFCDHANKYSAIVNGEYGLSNCILGNGYSIDCMLDRYRGLDWRDTKNWSMNNNEFPSRANSFYGKSIDPYEVIFHKWFWHDKPTVNYDLISAYVSRQMSDLVPVTVAAPAVRQSSDTAKNSVNPPAGSTRSRRPPTFVPAAMRGPIARKKQ